MKKIRIFALLVSILLLLGIVGAVVAQDNQENTYVSNNGALTIDYPEEWVAFEDGGLLILLSGEDVMDQDIPEPGSVMVTLLLPDTVMMYMGEDLTATEVTEGLMGLLADEGFSFGEIEAATLGDTETELVTVSLTAEGLGEGILGAVVLEEGTLGIWVTVPENEWADAEPVVMGMLETASYVLPVLELPEDNAVAWETESVALSAENFYIVAGGKVYTADVDAIDIGGDPGDEAYTTLEITWEENDTPMRLYIYFEADGENWYAYEIRTYDGSADGEWIYYEDGYFTTPLSEPFTDDFVVEYGSYSLVLEGLELQAFTD